MSKQISVDPNAKYLLDACIPRGPKDFSSEYVQLEEILEHSTSDEVILETAKKLGLIVITQDKGFVQRALSEHVPIIWQTYKGERYLVQGERIDQNCVCKSLKSKRTKYILKNDAVIFP